MPLLDFSQRNNPVPTVGSSRSTSSLQNFASRSFDDDEEEKKNLGTNSAILDSKLGGDSTYTPRTVDDARKIQDEDPTLWQRISKQLMKPVGVVSTLAEETGGLITDVAYGDFGDAGRRIKNTPKKVGGILTGTREHSFSDIWNEAADNGIVSKRVAFWAGLTTDLVSDPLNFVGIGALTKPGQVTAKVQKLNAAGETIKEGSKIWKDLKALGMLDDIHKLRLGATKAEQVQIGQRGLITLFANTPWEKTLVKGARFYDYTGKLASGIKQTKGAQIVGKIFSTKTSDEGFNIAKSHYNNLMEYRKGQAMEEAIQIQNEIGKLGQGEARQVIDVIEGWSKGVRSGIKEVDELAGRLRANFEDMRKTEEGLGLLKTDIQDYFPHIKVKDGEQLSGWQKTKAFFKTATGGTDEASKAYGDSRVYSTNLPSSKARKIEGTVSSINEQFGTEFFDSRPAVSYAQRALGHAKAVTSAEFFGSVKQFGKALDDVTPETANYVETGIKELDGLKFAPDVAEQLKKYQVAIKPEELNVALRTFDSVQNWWKAQALVAPSYHVRNFVGNMWNNFLGGVTDPTDYFQAGRLQNGKALQFTDDAGRVWDQNTLMKAARQTGVLGDGWYAKDIPTALESELGGLSWNPLKQNFGLFKANRAVGTTFENNARLAHFVRRLKEGNTIDEAAMSVKKYLFDYGDLTDIEKTWFKRVAPFYTWTRKNIPLQLENAVTQPGKFATIPKTTEAIESQVEKPNEKYLGDYIRDNVGVRVGTDKEGNTLYFLMGNWLPAAQAVDFLSQPTENFVMMVSPFFKAPVELWSNQSSFFEDTFGQPSQIERYPEENQSFLGFTMRKKTAYILKNIRILNELDKLNPGSIFGDKDSPSLVNRIAPEAGFRAPFGIGTVTTSEKRGGRFTPDGTQADRVLQSMFGKTSVYNPNFAKRFYLWDTETKVRELDRAIKDAQRDGQKEYAKRLREELQNIKRER